MYDDDDHTKIPNWLDLEDTGNVKEGHTQRTQNGDIIKTRIEKVEEKRKN